MRFHCDFVLRLISRVPDQNGVSQASPMVEIHQSGQKSSVCSMLILAVYMKNKVKRCKYVTCSTENFSLQLLEPGCGYRCTPSVIKLPVF